MVMQKVSDMLDNFSGVGLAVGYAPGEQVLSHVCDELNIKIEDDSMHATIHHHQLPPVLTPSS